MRAQAGLPEAAVEQRSGHKLFIEGQEESFDRTVMEELLRDQGVVVKPLGPCRHVREAATALHVNEPTYYFLIDRDYHDDSRDFGPVPRASCKGPIVFRVWGKDGFFGDPQRFEVIH